MIGVAGYQNHRAFDVVIGVDTHKDQHVAVAIDERGVRLSEKHVPTTTCGYEELERWSRSLGAIHAFGIEGTGSYGAGVARFLTGRSYTVIEVNRPDRSVRYRKGKSDPTDAEMAARAALSGVADATPKSGEGEVEMIRMLKSAKDSAVLCSALSYTVIEVNRPDRSVRYRKGKSQGSYPGHQPDEGSGCDGSGRASRNA